MVLGDDIGIDGIVAVGDQEQILTEIVQRAATTGACIERSC
jgi:hypothetical protein